MSGGTYNSTLSCIAVFESLTIRAPAPEPPSPLPNPGGEDPQQQHQMDVLGFKDTLPPPNASVEDVISYIKVFKTCNGYVAFARDPNRPPEPVATTLECRDANDLYLRGLQWKGMKSLTTEQAQIIHDFIKLMSIVVRLAG